MNSKQVAILLAFAGVGLLAFNFWQDQKQTKRLVALERAVGVGPGAYTPLTIEDLNEELRALRRRDALKRE